MSPYMFRHKHYTLRLFRALHPKAQDVTEEMIEIVSLEHILVDNNYNGMGFGIGDRLIVLVEAQPTRVVNLVIRLLM